MNLLVLGIELLFGVFGFFSVCFDVYCFDVVV